MQLKSIKSKIVLMSGVCLLATTVVLLLIQISSQNRTQEFVSERVNSLIREQTKTGLLALAGGEARFIQSKLETNIVTARTLADVFKTIHGQKDLVDSVNVRSLFSDILLEVLKDNEEFLGTYSAWEPDALDGKDSLYAGDVESGHDSTGRFVPYWNRDENGKIARQALVGYEDSHLTLHCVADHHERLNGCGYPRGLRGDQIGLAARVTAIADSFAAMTSNRRHKEARPIDDSAHSLARDTNRYDERLSKNLLCFLLTGK